MQHLEILTFVTHWKLWHVKDVEFLESEEVEGSEPRRKHFGVQQHLEMRNKWYEDSLMQMSDCQITEIDKSYTENMRSLTGQYAWRWE